MALQRMEATAKGEVARAGEGYVLKVDGTEHVFVLKEDPKGKGKVGEKSALLQLFEAVERGEKVITVTGELEGWVGNLTNFTKQVPAKPRAIQVQSFEVTK